MRGRLPRSITSCSCPRANYQAFASHGIPPVLWNAPAFRRASPPLATRTLSALAFELPFARLVVCKGFFSVTPRRIVSSAQVGMLGA